MAVLWVDASHACPGSMPLATGRATSPAESAFPPSSNCPVPGREQGRERERPARPCQGVSFPLQVNGWAEVCVRGLQCQRTPQHPQPLQWGAPGSGCLKWLQGLCRRDPAPQPDAGAWAEPTIASVGSLKSCCAIQANQGTSALYFVVDSSALLPALHAGGSH